MKLIIDTDCGVDDAFALIAALKLYNVIAITCVSGNVYIDNVVNNVGVLLELCDKPHIPFFKGSSDFILNNWQESKYLGHGSDGLGDINMKTNLKIQDESAINALIRLTQEYDDVHIIAIGPLTNIALASLVDNDFPNRVRSFTIMGGAEECKGNVSFTSEFNIDCDPEAAKICLNKFSNVKTRMITLESSHECELPWDLWDKITKSDNKYAQFLTKISNKMLPYCKTGYMPYDLIAMLSYLAEDKERTKLLYCDIELSGNLTRGATIFDWRHIREPNILLLKMNKLEIFKLIEQIAL